MSKNIDGNFKVSPTHTNHEKSDLQAFINDENDEEELLRNRPINPLSEEENLVIQMIGNTEQDEPNIWINTKMTTSQLLHQTHDEKKKVVPLKEQIPEEYHEFLDIFDEKKADCFPSTLHSPTQSEWIRVNLGVFRAEFGRNFGLVGMC